MFRKLKEKSPKYVEFDDWERRGFAAPSPHFVKQQVLARHSPENVVWVETGTYLGDTTEFLARRSKHVISIEPEPLLFQKAEQRFRGDPKVSLLNGTSESLFAGVVSSLTGNVAFWLDGHYSAGGTFKGSSDTPIVSELAAVEGALKNLERVAVFVDDVRCFNPNDPNYKDYPSINVLIEWTIKNNMTFYIEHDILVAKNFQG